MQKSYKDLCAKIQEEFKKASDKSESNFRYQKVLSNWYVGQTIEEYTDNDNNKAKFIIIEKLSKDLDVNKRYLQELCRFYKLYLKTPKNNGLKWTQYQQLMTITDKTERDKWERRIIKDSIGCKPLAKMLYENKVESRGIIPTVNEKLSYIRGIPYLYHVIKIKSSTSGKAEMVIDCGFYIECTKYINNNSIYKSGDMIRSIRSENGFNIKRARNEYRPKMYTYKAHVLNVVDGDTLQCSIDVGFNMRIRCKVRLRGVDAPELNSLRGGRSKEFVQEQLQDLNFIVVKSYGKDLYGRYLVDVFYKSNCNDPLEMSENGIYLNQGLIDQGLAEIWKK